MSTTLVDAWLNAGARVARNVWFTPEVCTPDQWSVQRGWPPEFRSHVELWQSALVDAIYVARGEVSAPHAERERTRRWFCRSSSSPRSFLWICEILGWEPSAVRRYALHDGSHGRDGTRHRLRQANRSRARVAA
jgi:hypothetical protein